MDPDLNLTDKILPDNPELKPQAKQLQTRGDYLIKLLKKEVLKKDAEKQAEILKKAKKPRPKKKRASARVGKAEREGRGSRGAQLEREEEETTSPKSQEHVSEEEGEIKDEGNGRKMRRRKRKERGNEVQTKDVKKKKEKKEKKEKRTRKVHPVEAKVERKERSKRPAAPQGPVHIMAGAEPVPIAEEREEDLDQKTFSICKEKMRPVKKALKQLDKPEEGLSEHEQLLHTRHCLLHIGDHIAICLQSYTDPDQVKLWRRNLWIFVSKFTEFDARKLHKLYKHAVKKRSVEPSDHPKVKGEEKAVPSAGTKKPFHPEPSGSSRDSTHSQQTNYSTQSVSGGLPPASAPPPPPPPPQPHHREGYTRQKRINSDWPERGRDRHYEAGWPPDRHHPGFDHVYKDRRRYGDGRTGQGSYHFNEQLRKRQYPYTNDNDHRDFRREDRYHSEQKRRRLTDFRPHNHCADFRGPLASEYHNPQQDFRLGGPEHYRYHAGDKGSDLHPADHRSPFGSCSPLDSRPMDPRPPPDYSWTVRKV
uniref:chromodomain-helicase-DNA-binding protein 2-like n=1 Tax=Myxine glutinosa TaxID=7769 RepID=UPI00358E1390